MELFIDIAAKIGTSAIDIFWLPVGIWTVIALFVYTFTKVFETHISAAYHYHSRVALLWSLAAGVLASALLYYIPLASAGTALPAKFIVIQNPISVTASAASAGINWSAPAIWIGLITGLLTVVAIGAVIKLMIDFFILQSFSGRLQGTAADLSTKLSDTNRNLLTEHNDSVRITFSDEVSVPCTFGWVAKHIVLPRHLLNEKEKLNMALRHELTHITNGDFLLNASVQLAKAVFWFHPLVHILANHIEEYREIYCDQHVLQDEEISQRNYATLLFELSPKRVFKTRAAVSMAVNPSTLKKRIQTMKSSTPSLPSLKWSLSFMLVVALMVTGIMACSDIEEGGITKAEFEETQADMNESSSNGLSVKLGDSAPLFVVDGDKIDNNDSKGFLNRLKPEYIESIDVLKGQQAIDKYGQAGKNGVVNITLIDKEKAMSDLRTDEEMQALKNRASQPNKPSKPTPGGDYYIAVDNAPKIKGGLQAIMNEATYPKECKDAGIEGRIMVQFIINKQGEAENPQILSGIGGGCDEEALRVVKQADFEPGTQDGQPVRVQMTIPIVFKL